MRKSALLALFLLLGLGSMAQSTGSLSLKIQDEKSGEPLGYVSVVLRHLPDSAMAGGQLSDAQGKVSFTNLPQGSYILRLSFVGYKNRWAGPVEVKGKTELGAVKMQVSNASLKEVNVTEDRQYMQNGIDRKVYNVGRDLNSQGGNAGDVLGNIPSVSIDVDRSVSLRGNSGVTVLIDGKPSALLGGSRQAVLDQIPASQIESVEVITNPSAKYDPDGTAGIINIILKKNKLNGWNGTFNTSIGSRDKYTAGLTLTYRQGKWNSFLTYSGSAQMFFLNGFQDRTNSRDTLFFMHQEMQGYNRNRTHSLRAGVDYALSDKENLSISGGINNKDDHTFWSYNYLFLDSNYKPNNQILRETGASRLGNTWDVAVQYRRLFKKPKKSFSIDASWSDFTGPDMLDAVSRFFLSNQQASGAPAAWQKTYTPKQNTLTTLQTDFILPLGKVRLETGAKFIFRRLDNDFFSQSQRAGISDWAADVNLNNHFIYTEKVYSAYSVLNFSLGKWGVAAGLRGEVTDALSEQKTTGNEFPLQYANLFPSLAVSRKLSSTKEMTLNLSRRITRPSPENLNPFPEYTDPYNLTKGNPYVRPEYTSGIELGYQQSLPKGSLSVNAYYRYTYNIISRFRTVGTDGVTVLTFLNLNSSNTYGTEVTLAYDPVKRWKNILNFNYFWQFLNGQNTEGNLSNNSYGGFVRYTSSFKITPKLELQGIYNYTIMGVLLQGKLDPMYSLDLALRQEVLKGKGSLSLRLSDVFDQRNFGVRTSGVGFSSYFTRKRETQILMLSFSYRFGSGKETSIPKRKVEPGIEEGGGGGF